MPQSKRVFIIVLDSFGIGEMPDADRYGDRGSNTLAAVAKSSFFHVPNLQQLGLFNIDGVNCGLRAAAPSGAFARIGEASEGKDTTTGHWEIAGIVSPKAMPTYPNGFPQPLLEAYAQKTGRGVLCNLPYSGTQVILDYGREHMETGALIVYTSADSVFQVAAHEEIIPIHELYHCCRIARDLLTGEHAVGRVIARPFTGAYPDFKRTANRHDYSLAPPRKTMLDYLADAGLDTIGVGKIHDIFAGRGIGRSLGINRDNQDGMDKTIRMADQDFNGLCFVNLVDFDMIYGHRNNVDGYAGALTEFDLRLGELLPLLCPDDFLIITADHGCDPSTPSTDHSREYVPMLLTGGRVRKGADLGTLSSFGDIAATVLDYFGVAGQVDGTSFLKRVVDE